MTTPLTDQEYYDNVLIPQASLAHTHLTTMLNLLNQERQTANVAHNHSKVASISAVLRKIVSGRNASTIINLLDNVAQQQGAWKISPHRSLTERSDDAGELLSEAGQLGQDWLLLLQSYTVPGLPKNPIFNP